MIRKIIVFSLLTLLVSAVGAFAQVGYGELKGYVYDEQGAVIQGAEVKLSSPSMMGDRTDVTNERGMFRFISLPPGTYTLTVGKENYKQFEQQGITFTN